MPILQMKSVRRNSVSQHWTFKKDPTDVHSALRYEAGLTNQRV